MRLASLTLPLVSRALLASAALASCPSVVISREAPPELPQPVSPSEVIGRIGAEPVTAAQVMAQGSEAFANDLKDYELSLHQIELRHRESQHQLLQTGLDALLDHRALALEAQGRGTSEDAVLAELKVPEVTEAEMREFYESRKALTTQTFDELRPQIEQRLRSEHMTLAHRAFYDALRAKHEVVAMLLPYRLAVAALGPARGNPGAPVTIVEFADFQCPFCRAAEHTLNSVLANHQSDVRLVFRNMPLQAVHPNAEVAARAGVCAESQGKFWEMHDAMFDQQDALAQPQLERTAGRLGLKLMAFDACMTDPRTLERVKRDAALAAELNINSAPFFFINGRPLHGSLPAEQFESVIADELQRSGSATVQAAR